MPVPHAVVVGGAGLTDSTASRAPPSPVQWGAADCAALAAALAHGALRADITPEAQHHRGDE
eukprot:2583840-Pyramimonas_sp.AAC.1